MRLQVVVTLALAVVAAPLAAQQGTPAAPAAVRAPIPAADKKFCRVVQSTGSIMPGKRTCHTRSEWVAIDRANGQGVDTFRNRNEQRGSPTSDF